MASAAFQCSMRYGNLPMESPAEMLADGHVTCSISCLNGDCRHAANIRLSTLPKDQHWPRIRRRLLCVGCGSRDTVNVTPNWHDRIGHAIPFTREWKT